MLTKYFLFLTSLIFIFTMTACATEEGLTSLPSDEPAQPTENTALTPLTNETPLVQTAIEESPAPTPTLLPTQEPVEVESPSCSKNALFIADVTIFDGTVIEAGESFEKIWRVKNTGSCPWLDAYQWRVVGGESAGAPTFVPINSQVPPDSEYELAVTFTAPQLEQGTRELYSQWQLHDEHGTPFGDQIYLVINVAANHASEEPQPTPGPTPTPFPESAPPTPASIVPAPPLTIEALENGEYQANNGWVTEETIKLTNNSYRTVNEELQAEVEVRLSEAKGFGDLNGDGSLDAVVVLVFEPLGATGTFVHLAAVINENGTPRHVATLLLGDRTPVHAIWFEGEQIMVELTTHGSTDPFCCPSLRITQRYQLQGERLVLLSN